MTFQNYHSNQKLLRQNIYHSPQILWPSQQKRTKANHWGYSRSSLSPGAWFSSSIFASRWCKAPGWGRRDPSSPLTIPMVPPVFLKQVGYVQRKGRFFEVCLGVFPSKFISFASWTARCLTVFNSSFHWFCLVLGPAGTQHLVRTPSSIPISQDTKSRLSVLSTLAFLIQL